MRLLNARTKILEEFFDDSIPPYAILSHTWGPNEPIYRDFAAPGNRDANVKIDGCCDQALLDGYGYVWIDTICIDKSSSAELTEAINSMYTWYESAGVCYAYLSDVSSDHDTPVAQLADPDTDFRRSKWFTRGWTLQELIAPRRVVFYNFRWLYIMEKTVVRGSQYFGLWEDKHEKQDDWHHVLEKITKIPFNVLEGNAPLSEIAVAARMTWAAHRRTTRKEDIAYCLLGIFKINMSMLYGEGDRAFTRLQEEIIRTSDDETIFAWGFQNGNTHLVQDVDGNAVKGRLLASSPTDFLGCEKIQTFSPVDYFGSGHSMSTHYSLTNKGLLIDRPLVVLPAPFHTALAPLNCGPPSKILALPLGGGKICDEAQLVVDSSCCPILIGNHPIGDNPVKTKIYISTRSLAPVCSWHDEELRIKVIIQDTLSGLSVKGVYVTWFLPPSVWRRDTASGVYLLSKRGAIGLEGLEPPAHTLIDLVCPNGQRYMVHLVESYASATSNIPSFTAGVSQQGWNVTAVEDIFDLKEGGYFAPEVSQALWPATSDDGYVRLELLGPGDGLYGFVAPWARYWTLKIHVSCGTKAAT
jgi:hypothetical protein